MPVETMAQRIKLQREALGFSKTDLARAVGVTPTAVWNWEENNSRPRPEVLSGIADILNVSLEYILNGDGFSNADSFEENQTPAEIIRSAEIKIASLNGVPVERVKLRLQILPE